MKKIIILTGAGISQESGISTFRDQNGLWESHSIDEVATLEGFNKNPALVHAFYNQRRRQLAHVEPNAAHLALSDLEKRRNTLLITQNVDDLHQRAGSKKLIAMHGELKKARCVTCDWLGLWEDDLKRESVCPTCKNTSCLRPHIVWFGEVPLFLDKIIQELQDCSIFLSIGTSAQVYPAAGFVHIVPKNAHKIEVNVERTGNSHLMEFWGGRATDLVPKLLKEL